MNFTGQNRMCHAERSSVIRPRSGIITLSISGILSEKFVDNHRALALHKHRRNCCQQHILRTGLSQIGM